MSVVVHAGRGVLKPNTAVLGTAAPAAVGRLSVRQQQLGALLDCLERLLVQPYPLPVPLPTTGVVLLLFRILSIGDAAGDRPLPQAARVRAPCLRHTSMWSAAAPWLLLHGCQGRGARVCFGDGVLLGGNVSMRGFFPLLRKRDCNAPN
jgi:hypothetical protein